MIPRVHLATASTSGGGRLDLYRRGDDYTITIDGQELMNSRQHASELALARLGCHHLCADPAEALGAGCDRRRERVLIGGLGMGYTLRQALDLLSPHARVVVAELNPDLVDWNREHLGTLNRHPLMDPRVALVTGDVVDLIAGTTERFDAILLDVDNGPDALSDPRNHRLYGPAGLQACRRALRPLGCLAVWSAGESPRFERLVRASGLRLSRFRVPAYHGGRARPRVVWVAARRRDQLPRGGAS